MKKSKISLKAPDIKKTSGGSVLDPSLMMDGTAHTEISIMGNVHYSEEIIESTEAASDLDKLRTFKKDKQKFLKVGREMLNKLCGGKDALGVHDDAFSVKFLIKVGIILSEIETAFRDVHKYTEWIRNNFGHDRLRYFQHAQQLSGMGDTALKYASLGKNRLLDFERARKEFSKESGAEKTLDDLLKKHPFLDTTKDMEGDLFKQHVNAIISYYRFKEQGIDFITFDQASYVASLNKEPVQVNKIVALKKELDEIDKIEDKETFLNDYINNKLALPTLEGKMGSSPESLNKLLADLIKYCETVDIGSPAWKEMQKEIISRDIFEKAFGYLSQLRVTLGIAGKPHKRRKKR